MQAPPDADNRNSKPARQCPWWRALLAPILDIHRPQRAGANMADAPRWVVLVCFALGVLACSAVLVGLLVWDATVESRVTRTTSAATGRVSRVFELIERTPAEVWAEQPSGGWLGLVAPVMLYLCATTVVAVMVVAWVYLVDVHRVGSAWGSYRRAVMAVIPAVGTTLVIIALVGSAVVSVQNTEQKRHATNTITGEPYLLLVVTYVAYPSCPLLLLFWAGHAVRGASREQEDVKLPPRCEGCGYDLTHIPDNRLCPECGANADRSLGYRWWRVRCAWEDRPTLANWLAATWVVVSRPAPFYRGLRLRTPARRATSFARWHYGIVAFLTACWAGIVAIVEVMPGGYDAVACFAFMALCVSLLTIWGLHRVIAALSVTVWMVQPALPDFSWARKVVSYESAFLWCFFLFNIGLGTTCVRFGEWLSGVVGWRALGIGAWWPLEVYVFAVGDLALVVLWFWRYRVALRSIRWSNA